MGQTQFEGSTNYTDPGLITDMLIKDIKVKTLIEYKTIEAIHMEMIYSSSLRYTETVLEALDMPLDCIRLQGFDVRDWAEECLAHITKAAANKYPTSSILGDRSQPR
jgi:hypothetical protein